MSYMVREDLELNMESERIKRAEDTVIESLKDDESLMGYCNILSGGFIAPI